MADEKSVKELTEVAVALAHLAGAGVKNIQEGGVNLEDYAGFLTSLPAALQDIDEIPAEVSDISTEEFIQVSDEVLRVLGLYGIVDMEVAKKVIAAAVELAEAFFAVKTAYEAIKG